MPRYTVPGQPQHVIQRGNNRAAVFSDANDHLVFAEWLADACVRHDCDIHAYVFMTNHLHLVLTPWSESAIGKVMQSVGRRYVHYFNRKQRRTGALWEGRYRATLIDSEAYLLRCYRYVELNPVRAGLVADPALYPWSSYRCNALGHDDSLVTMHELYFALGPDTESRQSAYRALFASVLDEPTMAEIRAATNKAWVLGQIQEGMIRLNRRARPLARGGDQRREQIHRMGSDSIAPTNGV
jgi:putative transposase